MLLMHNEVHNKPCKVGYMKEKDLKDLIIFWCDIVVVVDSEQLLLEWMKLCIRHQLNMSLSVLSMYIVLSSHSSFSGSSLSLCPWLIFGLTVT